MSDLKVTIEAALDKESLKTAERELASSIIGGGGRSGGSGGSGSGGGSGGGSSAFGILASMVQSNTAALHQLLSLITNTNTAINQLAQVVTHTSVTNTAAITQLTSATASNAAANAAMAGQMTGTGQGRRYAIPGTHAIARGISTIHQLGNAGVNNASIANSVGTIGGMLLPELKPVIDAVTSIFTDSFNKQDRFREQALRRYQVGGAAGLDIDENQNGYNIDAIRKASGFNITQFSTLYNRGAKSGIFDKDKSPQETMASLMFGEAGLGIGNEMTALLGASRKQGASNETSNILGNAIGLAVSEHMSKGRIGEVFTQLTRAVDSNTKAQTDIGDTANRLLFVSTLGDQYRGDTGAARDMNQAIKGLAGGSTPFTQYTTLKAAGLGKGVGYNEAWLKSQRGLGTQGGVGFEDLIAANFGNAVTQYANAQSEGERSAVVHTISSMTGMNGAQVDDILKRLAKDDRFNRIDASRGFSNFQTLTNVPRNLVRPRSEAAVGEDVFRFGIGNTSDHRGYAPDTSPFTLGGSASSSSARTAPGGGNTARRAKLEAYARQFGLPASSVGFLEKWIDIESGGNIGSLTQFNERGLFQIMGGYDSSHPFKGSQADMLGMSENDHRQTSTDEESSLKWGVKSVAFLRKQAEKLRDKFGLQWNESDMWKLTKLEHGGSANASDLVDKATKQLGRAPRDWSEMSQASLPLATPQERNVLNNSNKMLVEVQVHDRRVTATVTQRPGTTNAPGQTAVKR